MNGGVSEYQISWNIFLYKTLNKLFQIIRDFVCKQGGQIHRGAFSCDSDARFRIIRHCKPCPVILYGFDFSVGRIEYSLWMFNAEKVSWNYKHSKHWTE